jgi:hypothetical protein
VRRVLAVAFVLLVLSACASTERPEGIVERWLLALNQGAAGEPGLYAPAQVSDAVLPGWEELDSGGFDVIEVGNASSIMNVCDEGRIVPFRVVPLDGEEVSDAACVVASRVVRLAEFSDLPARIFPSGGGPAIFEDRTSGWLIAVAIGLGILFLGEGLMRLTRRSVVSSDASGVGSRRGGDDA